MNNRYIISFVSLFMVLISYAQDYNAIMNGDFKNAINMQQNGQLQQSHVKMKALAENGFPLAQFEIARNYDSGIGCSVDFNEAYKWMSKAAYNTTWNKVPESVRDFQGDAFFYLGVYNMNGMGTSKNIAEAVKLWQKGSTYSSPYQANCYLQLGFGYQRGWGGLDKNLSKAKDMFRMASDLGNPDAPYYLAEFYAQGIGGATQSDSEAFKYIKLSAERGYADGQCLLGEIYDNGYIGQPKNRPLAIEWWKKAAKQGNSNAIGYLTELGVSW